MPPCPFSCGNLCAHAAEFVQGKKVMIEKKRNNLPKLFENLMAIGCLSEAEIYTTSDGLCAVMATIAEVLAQRGNTTRAQMAAMMMRFCEEIEQ